MNNITNPNAFRGSIVARRTYQRPKQRGGFESWNELVDRVINHQKYLWERQLGRNLNQKERSELVLLGNLIREKKALLAGRTLWLGGTETSKRRHISNFNCSYISIKTVNDVVDAFWLLLNGSGVGFKPIPGLLNGFKKPINDVVVINTTKGPDEKGREENVETFEDGVWTIKVGDSGEAWAKSIGKLLAGKYQADKLVLDFSEVRGAGGRLAGYGWISSGDKVISEVYPKIAKLLSNRAGRLLDEIDILDIINYLGVIQTGRRGAEIALLDYGNRNWERFATAKKDFWLYDNHHRTQSNNSLMFNERPSFSVLGQVLEMMWESGGSEPGLINAKELKRRAPWAEGVNPCCVTGTTPILTDNGYIPIRNLIGKEIDVWNGEQWSSVTPFSTGVHPIWRVTLSDGSTLDCTNYHKWVLKGGGKVETKDLEPGDKLQKFKMPVIENTISLQLEVDPYSQGFYSGDGNTGLERSWIYGPKLPCSSFLKGEVLDFNEELNRAVWKHGRMLPKTFVPFTSFSVDTRVKWLTGLLDADGTVTRDVNGNGLQLTSVDKKFLLDVKLMLTTLGIRAKVISSNNEGYRSMPDGQGGYKDYLCKETHRLLIGNTDTHHLVTTLKAKFHRLEVHDSAPQRDARQFVTVVSVEDLGIEAETFCFSEPIANRGTFNGIVTGNCEILLADKGVCNLVEVDLNAFDRWVDLEQAVYLIARANYRQTLVDFKDGILQDSWHQANEFLRLCGVSLTGWALVENKISDHDIKRLKNLAVTGAYSMAMELGTELPKNVTTIKPSGSVSKVMGTTEGVHRPLGRFIFNNITFSKHEPIVEVLRNHGYNVFDNPSQPDGVVVTFPIRWDALAGGTQSALEQLNNYKRTMLNWTEQNTSVTISYDEGELEDIQDWLIDNWDNYVGVSFIKRTDPTKSAKDLGYLYLPQEVVDESRFNDYLSRLKPIDEELLFDTGGIEDVDFLDECDNGVCPVR